jgi:hypothetical protein
MTFVVAPFINGKGAWETIEVAHAPFIGLQKNYAESSLLLAGQTPIL